MISRLTWMLFFGLVHQRDDEGNSSSDNHCLVLFTLHMKMQHDYPSSFEPCDG